MTRNALTSKEVLHSVFWVCFSFALGKTWGSILNYLSTNRGGGAQHGPIVASSIKDSNVLTLQSLSQREIQQLIRDIQYQDCTQAPVVLSPLEHPKDGFASEIQYVARLLQMAVSTRRVLIMSSGFKSAYEAPECRTKDTLRISGWTCLWEPVSATCQQENLDEPTTSTTFVHPAVDEMDYPLGSGIISQRHQTSVFFDTAWYGSEQKTVHAPISFSRREDRSELRPDVLSYWERSYGRYWVRSQMVHYLWRPNQKLQTQIDARFPAEFAQENPPAFIGFHIRYTDNILDFQKHFARNATLTRSFARFMEFAEEIRDQHFHRIPPLRHIYLATDNPEIIEQSQQPEWNQRGWEFVIQANVQRTNTRDRLWFQEGRGAAAGAIATDLEVLRRAHFLVGSFQSNVFRLACELNTAFHVEKYPWDRHRHWTVDVEWYEDP